MKKDLLNKIKNYSKLASVLTAVGGTANAQIVSTNITDTTLNTFPSSYTIDFNNDDTTDARIVLSNVGLAGKRMRIGKGLDIRDFCVATSTIYTGFISPNIFNNYSVNSHLQFLSTSGDLWVDLVKGRKGVYDSFCSCTPPDKVEGLWLDRDKKNIGVLFTISGKCHWGWVKVTTLATAWDTMSVTIHSYAYDTITAPCSICSGSLPIKLLSFTANKQENKIELNWQTATETNNNYFVVERSKDAIKFEEITRLSGAGNSNSVLNYSAIDEKSLPATNYYRLKQVDYDGKFTYSKIIAVNNSNNLQDITINQFENKLNITNTTDKEYSINIIDIQGKSVYQKNNIIGLQNIDLSNINKGIYLIKIYNNEDLITKKIIL